MTTMEDLKNAWSDVEPIGGSSGASFDELDIDDKYLGVIEHASVGNAKGKSKRFQYVIVFKALTGPNAGRKNCVSNGLETPGNIGYFMGLLNTLGHDCPAQETLDTELPLIMEQLKGVGIELSTKQNGEYKNTYINSVEDVSSLL